MSDLRLYIEKQKLTQAQAAKRLGISQFRVSDLCAENGPSSALEYSSPLKHGLGGQCV